MKTTRLFLSFIFITAFSSLTFSQTKTIDDFTDLNSWQRSVSDGAEMSLSLVDGIKGKAIKINYKFTGSGYCGIVKKIPMELPSNYKFSFFIKGNSPKNNLEFKLDDSTGDNVWWYVFRHSDFPKTWEKRTIRERQIKFAWGPQGGGDITKLDKIEIIISAAEGGSGTIYLDELSFTKLEPQIKYKITPIVQASSTLTGKASYIFDGKNSTYWESEQSDKQSLLINFNYRREYGGIIINWDSLDFATNFTVDASENGSDWQTLYEANNESRKISFIRLPDYESNYLKINLLKSSRGKGYSIKEIEIEDYKFTENDNHLFQKIATYYPKGYFPKYFSNEQAYWNIIGVNGGLEKGLISEKGIIEIGKESCSITPFLYCDKKFVTWNDVTLKQNLDKNYLPITNVIWNDKNLTMEIKTFAVGKVNSSTIFARYKITNNTNQKKKGSLYLAIRPFQVNPPWQNLNTTGGVSKIRSIAYSKAKVIINDNKTIVSITDPGKFGAVNFNNGEIIDYISKDIIPDSTSVNDETGLSSGALEYSFNIAPGRSYNVVIAIPLNGNSSTLQSGIDPDAASRLFSSELNNATKFWQDKLNNIKFDLPSTSDKIINTFKSNLAYILINSNGNALQPGSRCYDRAWIRDGALMAEALLYTGLVSEVKDFIYWYTKYQFPSGKIPCAVDKIGPSPVPENDSQGEYIFLVKEYFNFTKDTTLLKNTWENVKAAVDYIKYQISLESTDENKYGTDEQKSFYGLVPKSISHEGYSAKPMHSYWDDFFVMKGLKDAVGIAKILNKDEEVKEYSKLRDEFRKNLYYSIKLAMKNKGINYIPGCAELGDFDATSTTIAISPCDELSSLPEPALKNTFNKYFDYFEQRLSQDYKWINYTPYEIRIVDTFIRLGEKQRAFDLLNFFFHDQRPYGWNHWAEVVWKDRDTPKFIGDMPHSWVGSGYINAVRTMFVYENDDTSLTIGAGIEEKWFNSPKGISIKNLPTFFGNVSYSMAKKDNKVKVEITCNVDSSCKMMVLKSPLEKQVKNILVNGKEFHNFKDNNIYLNPNDKEILIEYE